MKPLYKAVNRFKCFSLFLDCRWRILLMQVHLEKMWYCPGICEW